MSLRYRKSQRTVVRSVAFFATFLCLMALASAALAWTPRIQIVVDPDEYCLAIDTQPGFITVSVHSYSDYAGNPEALGAQFRVAAGAGFTGVLVSEDYTSSTVHIGNVTDGLQVAFGTPPEGCHSGDFVIVRLTYQVFGTSAPCSTLEVLPYPGDSSVMVMDCNDNLLPTSPYGPVWINYSSACGGLWCVPLATEPTTWGKVKALYR